ncbi:MAG: hypothetical protein ASARMPREDX12_005677 [Alectoria sarmentosa]|nr:MAG: hypothetical protein ASARMPREDX12_005677 [Alectoria sarmentosa]
MPVFSNADMVATIIDNITDLPTLCNFASVFPVAGLVFAQYFRSILAHTVSNDLVVAFVASTEYTNQGEPPVELFIEQTINKGCPQTRRLPNGCQILETLLVIDDAIQNFSTFLQIIRGPHLVQSYKIKVKPGLVSYLSSLIRPPYHRHVEQGYWNPYQASEALWHLEIYNARFLASGSTAYKTPAEQLSDQAHYLQQLGSITFWTLYSISTHFRQTLNSPTLHHTQHRLYEILKLGHGSTQSQRRSGRGFRDNRRFFEKPLAYQLSLALPEMLRVFHHQWSKHLQGPVPDVPYGVMDRRSPREVFHQR